MSSKIACQVNNPPELSRVVRFKTNEVVTGLQAYITLPSDFDFAGINGFINFYLGFAGWETGISIKPKNDGKNPNEKWHWFVNGGPHKGEGEWNAPWNINNGEKVFIKGWIDTEGHFNFQVKNTIVYKSKVKIPLPLQGSESFKKGRIVVACAQHTSMDAPWVLKHNQVIVEDYKYRDAANNWIPVTSNNGNIDYFNCPQDRNNGVGDNKHYTFTEFTNSGKYLYASLK